MFKGTAVPCIMNWWAAFVFSVIVLNVNTAFVLKNELYELDIVHFNDFHDRFEETSVLYPVCRTDSDECIGGFARLYSQIQKLLKQKSNPLLLNAGDVFQGTYWYTLQKWNVEQKFINMLPIDVHAIGNHEFDDGELDLANYLAALHAPVVAANLNTSNAKIFDGLYQPHVVLEKKGRKIGIIGLITPETALLSNAMNVSFMDPIESARKEAQLLTDQGIDIIVVLSHCGLPTDEKIAEQVGEHIDIIVGGHSHSLLWNGEAPSKEPKSGPYPVLVEAKTKPGHKVVVVTASAFTKYLGDITLFFDEKGDVQHFEAAPVFLNRSIPEDTDIKALMQPYKDQLHAIVSKVVGSVTDDLLAEPCGGHECALGNMVADALLSTANETLNSSLPHISLVQRNTLRGSIPKGDINKGIVINVLPFTNKIWTMNLQGKYIFEALGRCLTVNWVPKPFSGPWIPHISGMKVTMNTTDGSVNNVMVKEGDSFMPLDMDKLYQFTTIDFLAKGGNGFKMIKDNARNITNLGVDTTLLGNYIQKISPITPYVDNRLTILS